MNYILPLLLTAFSAALFVFADDRFAVFYGRVCVDDTAPNESNDCHAWNYYRVPYRIDYQRDQMVSPWYGHPFATKLELCDLFGPGDFFCANNPDTLADTTAALNGVWSSPPPLRYWTNKLVELVTPQQFYAYAYFGIR